MKTTTATIFDLYVKIYQTMENDIITTLQEYLAQQSWQVEQANEGSKKKLVGRLIGMLV